MAAQCGSACLHSSEGSVDFFGHAILAVSADTPAFPRISTFLVGFGEVLPYSWSRCDVPRILS